MKDAEIIRRIKSFEADDGICIGVADMDSAICVSGRKQEKQREEFKSLDKDRIVIVVKEIEAWYLAGLDDRTCRELGIDTFDTTDNVTKSKFDNLWSKSKKFNSDVDFMQEILRYFDIETAKRKNKSFEYFVRKHLQGTGNIDSST